MNNHVQPGQILTIPAPAAIVSGQLVNVGQIVGVAAGDAASGDPLDLAVEGVFRLPKVSALAIAVGDLVYQDSENGLITKTASGNRKVGYAVSVAANPSGTVDVRLVPVV